MTAQQGTRRMSSRKFSDLNVHRPKILSSRDMRYKRTTERNVRQRSDKKSENQDTQRCTTIGHICQTNYQSNATIVQSYMLYSPTEARWIKVTKENDQVRNQNAKAKTDSTIYRGNTVKAECCEEIRSKVNMETSPDHSSHHGDPGRSHNCLTQHTTSHNISTSETQLPLLIGHDFAGIDLWRHGLHTILKRPLRYVFCFRNIRLDESETTTLVSRMPIAPSCRRYGKLSCGHLRGIATMSAVLHLGTTQLQKP